jgi:hypothetical protein
MSLFQCEYCGCCENTALSNGGAIDHERYDWTNIRERKGKMLCSECAPSKYANGKDTGLGKWHGDFEKVYLPLGEFKTNTRGNLKHKETGSTEWKLFAVSFPKRIIEEPRMAGKRRRDGLLIKCDNGQVYTGDGLAGLMKMSWGAFYTRITKEGWQGNDLFRPKGIRAPRNQSYYDSIIAAPSDKNPKDMGTRPRNNKLKMIPGPTPYERSMRM